MANVFCKSCKRMVEPGRFCSNCAAPLPWVSAAKPQASAGTKLITVGVIVGILVLLGLIKSVQENHERSVSVTTQSQPASPPSSNLPITAGRPRDLSDSERLSRARNLSSVDATKTELLEAREYLAQIPQSAPEFQGAKLLLVQIEPRIKKLENAEIPDLRERLRNDFRETVSQANSHLNFITSKITRAKGGYSIWAVHEYFSQLSFSIGDDAKVVSAWINANHADLKRAQIIQVGFRGSGPYSSWCGLTVN